MADITIDPTKVQIPSTVRPMTAEILEVAGINAGQVVHFNSDRQLELADPSDPTKSLVSGIAVGSGQQGQTIPYLATKSILFTDNALTQGVLYVLSETPGGISNTIPVTPGDAVVFLGIANSPSELILGILNAGVTI